MAKKNWLAWLKCNVIELIILVLILVLVIKAFSGPIPEETSEVQIIEESAKISEEVPIGIPEEVLAEEPAEQAAEKVGEE